MNDIETKGENKMREILFRGKRVDNGEWVYGLLARTSTDVSNIVEKKFDILTPVYTNTVGQYTGLTDKNGKKIFEGDIVFKRTYQGKKPMNVYFASGQFTCGVGGGSSTPSHYYTLDDKQVESIGNIFDNPELMKE